MTPSQLLKAVLFYLASTSTILPCASGAPITLKPNDSCLSPYLRLLGPKACAILNIHTECPHVSEEQAGEVGHFLSTQLTRRRVSFRGDLNMAKGSDFVSTEPEVFDPEHDIERAPDDGGFGAQPQPYEPPHHHRNQFHQHHYRGRCEDNNDQATCPYQSRSRHYHPLGWARQLLRKARYHSSDLQQLFHKVWLLVQSMPEKFAVAGAVAVFVVLSILVAAEKLGKASERRTKKAK